MKLSVNNKPVSRVAKQVHVDNKRLRKDFGPVDVYALAKYIRKLEKRIELLENK